MGHQQDIMDRDLRIIYMGTPDFAVPALHILLENGYNVIAVITSPDKPAGRGQKLQVSAVKAYAASKGLNILQPEKLKNKEFLEELRVLNANLQVVVAFRMLPEEVWNMPEYGTFNLHASLLPQYRGAAPINWAIINGEKETGVTSFFLQQEIDTGDLILQESVAIAPDDTAGTLHDKLMQVGANVVLKTVQLIENGRVNTTPQPQQSELKKAPKIFREDCLIDWHKKGMDIYNFIRGLSPYPAAYTLLLNGKILKIFQATFIHSEHHLSIGEMITDRKSYLRFAVADGYIDCLKVQLEGKSAMVIKDFLAGYKA